MIPTTPLVTRTFHPLRPQSSGELPVRVVSSAPVARPLPVANIGKQPTNVLLSADVLPVFKPLISISGQSFYLPVQAEDKFQQSLLLAESFHRLFQSSCDFSVPASLDLSAYLRRVRNIFAPEVFESAALEFVQNFNWSEDILARSGPQSPGFPWLFRLRS